MDCLDKRPRQVAVAVLGVSPPFSLNIAELIAANTPTVRGVVAHLGKAVDRTDP